MRRICAASVISMVLVPLAASAQSIEVVNDFNLGNDWFATLPNADTRPPAEGEFVVGPGAPPLGTGSFEMRMSSGAEKVQLVNYDYIGTLLADIDEMTYWTYRDGSSTNPAGQVPAINLVIDFNGPDAGGFATLVWEPNVPGGPGVGAVAVDTWQMWDAYDFGTAIWWSTRAFPGVPQAFNSFVTWDTIVTNNPLAEILGFIGLNAGSGWNGVFTGNVDAFTFGVQGTAITYDFEPLVGPPVDMEECKQGGWQTFNNPFFRNQGDCVSFVATGGRPRGNR